ncbi:MAG TPA: hypothetical protein VM840_11140 [Actinomycetota bacterium]|nr:hypothetical protein [Actinomycetota bacterium]
MKRKLAALAVVVGVLGGALALNTQPVSAGNCDSNVAMFFYYGTAEARRSVVNAAAVYCTADRAAQLGSAVQPAWFIPPGATGVTARMIRATQGAHYGFQWGGLLGHCDHVVATENSVAGQLPSYVADTPIHMFSQPVVSGTVSVQVRAGGCGGHAITGDEWRTADRYL